MRQAAIASAGESRPDAYIVFELAKRLGFGNLFWNGDINAGLNAILAPLGLTLDELRAQPGGISLAGGPDYFRYRREGFKTQTESSKSSPRFPRRRREPVATIIEPAQSPYNAEANEFPLVLTSAKVVYFCHGQHRHIPSLRRRSPEPEVSMHPQTAGERGIGQGDWVEIRTRTGKARMRAKFDASLDRRVVSGQYGWWQGNPELGLQAFDSLADSAPIIIA